MLVMISYSENFVYILSNTSKKLSTRILIFGAAKKCKSYIYKEWTSYNFYIKLTLRNKINKIFI
jgi:hypothetical protein